MKRMESERFKELAKKLPPSELAAFLRREQEEKIHVRKDQLITRILFTATFLGLVYFLVTKEHTEIIIPIVSLLVGLVGGFSLGKTLR